MPMSHEIVEQNVLRITASASDFLKYGVSQVLVTNEKVVYHCPTKALAVMLQREFQATGYPSRYQHGLRSSAFYVEAAID